MNIRKTWDFSEGGAQARLEAFLHDGEAPIVQLVICIWSSLNRLGNEQHHIFISISRCV